MTPAKSSLFWATFTERAWEMPGLPSWRCHSHLEPLARNSTFLVFFFENTSSVTSSFISPSDVVLWCTKMVSHLIYISNSDSSKCSEIEHSLHLSISHPFIFQHSMTSVRCGCGTLHNPFWVAYLTGEHWVSYFSGDLKCLRQYRAGNWNRLAIRGWSSETITPTTSFYAQSSLHQTIPNSAGGDLLGCVLRLLWCQAAANLRSSSHSPGEKPPVMTQESEIGSMKSGWILIDWIKLTEWYDEWVSNKWSYAWNLKLMISAWHQEFTWCIMPRGKRLHCGWSSVFWGEEISRLDFVFLVPCKFDVFLTERNFASSMYANPPGPQVGEARDVILFEMVTNQPHVLQLGKATEDLLGKLSEIVVVQVQILQVR